MTTALKANLNGGPELGPSGEPVFKIKLPVKLSIFVAATITLSWFFEGWRQVNNEPTLVACSILAAGTLATLALLGLYAFFIYAEERSRGCRTRKIPLFDKWYVQYCQRRVHSSTSEGDNK